MNLRKEAIIKSRKDLKIYIKLGDVSFETSYLNNICKLYFFLFPSHNRLSETK